MSQSSSSERERDRRGFRELAKLAGAPAKPRAQSISGIRKADRGEHDSGMIDLEAIASADPGAADRARVTPLASAPLFEDAEPAPRMFPAALSSRPAASPPPPLSSRPVASAPPPLSSRPLPPPSQKSMLEQPSTPAAPFLSAQAALASMPPRRSSVGRVMGALVGLAAIAAGSFFVVRAVQHPSVAAAPVAFESVAPPAAASPPGQVAVAAPPPAANPGVDPLSLPKEGTSAPAGHRATHAWKAAHAAQSVVAKADPVEPKGEQEVEKPVAKAPPPPAKEAAKATPPPASALLASIKQAAEATPAPAAAPVAEGAPVPAAAVVAPAGNAASQRPSQGAVTSALGAVIPDARECLNDGDAPSRARVVFGSDGAVQSVAVTGSAEGKPAAACISKALGKAHVPSFAEASYGATVTIRP